VEDQVAQILGQPETIDLQIEVIVQVERIIDIVRSGFVRIVTENYNCLDKNKNALDLKKKN